MRNFVILISLLIAASYGTDFSSSSSYEYEDLEFSSEEIEERVTGGNVMNKNELIDFKYQVGLLIHNTDRSKTICGGALIHCEVVLTAAHCLTEVDILGVFMGTLVKPRSIYTFDNSVIIVDKKNIISHEDYNSVTKVDDIAIIILPRAVDLNKSPYIGTIPLAKCATECESGTAWVSGWGWTNNDEESRSEVLNFVQVEPMKYDICKRYGQNLVPDKFLCTSGKDKKGTCRGDSGGPYAFEDGKGGRYLCGINSYRMSMSCEINAPRTKSSVPYYYQNGWICTNSRNKIGCDYDK